MPDAFNDEIRRGYAASRAKSARRLTVRDPADLDPEDVRTASIMAGDSVEQADAQARAHHARYGGEKAFDQMLRNDHAQAQSRRPKL